MRSPYTENLTNLILEITYFEYQKLFGLFIAQNNYYLPVSNFCEGGVEIYYNIIMIMK